MMTKLTAIFIGAALAGASGASVAPLDALASSGRVTYVRSRIVPEDRGRATAMRPGALASAQQQRRRHYRVPAIAGQSTRFSMKNSIMRSPLRPVCPRSGPTWTSKLLPDC